MQWNRSSFIERHPPWAAPSSFCTVQLGRFVDKFLLGNDGSDTKVLRSDRIVTDRARWLTWETPSMQ